MWLHLIILAAHARGAEEVVDAWCHFSRVVSFFIHQTFFFLLIEALVTLM